MAPEEKGSECEHQSTVLGTLSASVLVSCLPSLWPAGLAALVCSLTDHLLGAITGHSHGNLDEEEVPELKGWEDSCQGA